MEWVDDGHVECVQVGDLRNPSVNDLWYSSWEEAIREIEARYGIHEYELYDRKEMYALGHDLSDRVFDLSEQIDYTRKNLVEKMAGYLKWWCEVGNVWIRKG